MIEMLKPYFGGFVWLCVIGLYLWGTKEKSKCECNPQFCGKCGKEQK